MSRYLLSLCLLVLIWATPLLPQTTPTPTYPGLGTFRPDSLGTLQLTLSQRRDARIQALLRGVEFKDLLIQTSIGPFGFSQGPGGWLGLLIPTWIHLGPLTLPLLFVRAGQDSKEAARAAAIWFEIQMQERLRYWQRSLRQGQ